MPLFRNHIYFGIGNPISEDPPFDRDDEIARDHDIAYYNAKTFEDIKEADCKAIREFGRDLVETGNWHSLVGAVGLGVKTAAERILHRPIYPRRPGSFCCGKTPTTVDRLEDVEEAKEQKETHSPSEEQDGKLSV